jgi:iron complex outermembrane receptor protein
MSFATTQWLMGGNVLKEALTSGLTDSPIYSSYYIEDGSFLKCEYVNLGYTFKAESIKWIKNLRVYLTGQNLFKITKYKGLDPEVEMGGLTPGVEGRDYYPKSRTLMAGVNISF